MMVGLCGLRGVWFAELRFATFQIVSFVRGRELRSGGTRTTLFGLPDAKAIQTSG